MSGSYADSLRDPRWQKKRLERLSAAGWKCSLCGATEKTLHVHHGYYEKGVEPWDYPDNTLVVLCELCHKYQGLLLVRVNRLLGLLSGKLHWVIGFLEFLVWYAGRSDRKPLLFNEAEVFGFSHGLFLPASIGDLPKLVQHNANEKPHAATLWCQLYDALLKHNLSTNPGEPRDDDDYLGVEP